MTRKTKRTALAVSAPRDRSAAAAMMRELGDVQRELVRQATALGDATAALKEQAEEAARPLKDRRKVLEAALVTYAEANRAEICARGTKTADLGTGRIAWRVRPPKVSLRGKEAVLEACRSLGLARFIRVSEDVNKEAMLADPETAAAIAGVTIASEGEDIILEPAELSLEGAA